MGRVLLVTGVSRDLGRRFARAVAADPAVERVIGVDVVPPRGDIGEVSFVRADIRTPVIAKVLAKEDVDTVVHMSVISTPGRLGGRIPMKELNVIGTMQLLAACQQTATVDRVVVKSTTQVYGASSRDPAMFTEDLAARRQPRSGYGKDVHEIEGYVRGFARRRPDVHLTMLRAANVLGARVQSPIADYFRMPVIPRVLGFDPRLQFLHESDLIGAIRHAVTAEAAGTFNVAGDGILLLSQALRRLGRPSLPLPPTLMPRAGALLHRARLGELPPELRSLLTYGRAVDTTRMREVFGYRPRYTSAHAFEEFAESMAPATGTAARLVGDLEARLGGARA